jgi:hypothetical protein
VGLAKLQKLVNWVKVAFNNLHSRLQHVSTIIKPKKEDPRKETKFGATQVVNIIRQNWFLVDPIFQLLEFGDKKGEFFNRT